MWLWFVGGRCVFCGPSGSVRHVVVNAVALTAAVSAVAGLAAGWAGAPLWLFGVVCAVVVLAGAAAGVAGAVCVRRPQHNR